VPGGGLQYQLIGGRGHGLGNCRSQLNLLIHTWNDTRLPLTTWLTTTSQMDGNISFFHALSLSFLCTRPNNLPSRASVCVGVGQSRCPLDTGVRWGPTPCGWVWHQTTSLGMTIVFPPWSVGNICPQGGPRVLHLGILNPALFGTTHTCLVAIVVEHVSSHDVIGFEGLQSKVQWNRLDWAEGQTKNMCALALSEGAHSEFRHAVHHDNLTAGRG
jgi:hypothetical protein